MGVVLTDDLEGRVADATARPARYTSGSHRRQKITATRTRVREGPGCLSRALTTPRRETERERSFLFFFFLTIIIARCMPEHAFVSSLSVRKLI